MALVNLPLNSKGHPCPHWWRCHFSALMFTPLIITAVKWYRCRDWDSNHYFTNKKLQKQNVSQDLASKALLSSQLGICGITCVSIETPSKNTIYDKYESRPSQQPQNNLILLKFPQTIAPGGFCTIFGKPKPCKLVAKIKKNVQKIKGDVQQQAESLTTWLLNNDSPPQQSLVWDRLDRFPNPLAFPKFWKQLGRGTWLGEDCTLLRQGPHVTSISEWVENQTIRCLV